MLLNRNPFYSCYDGRSAHNELPEINAGPDAAPGTTLAGSVGSRNSSEIPHTVSPQSGGNPAQTVFGTRPNHPTLLAAYRRPNAPGESALPRVPVNSRYGQFFHHTASLKEWNQELSSLKKAFEEKIKDPIQQTNQEANIFVKRQIEILDATIAVLNVRNEGLSLRHFDTLEQFAAHLEKNSSTARHERAIVRTHGLHHVAFDVKNNGEKTSIIGVDSGGFLDIMPSVRSGASRVGRIIGDMPNTKASIITTHVQNSPSDCLTFALSYALKMRDAENDDETFSKLHDKHFEGRDIDDGAARTSSFDSGDPLMRDDGSMLRPGDNKNIYIAPESGTLVPRTFYKHMHSRKRAEKQINNAGWQDKSVNKNGDTLIERVTRHPVTRSDGLRELNYSASIEHKAVAFLDITVSHISDLLQSAENDAESAFRHQLALVRSLT